MVFIILPPYAALTANVTLCRSYLAASTTTKERTFGIAIIAAAQALGFVVGPGEEILLCLGVQLMIRPDLAVLWGVISPGVLDQSEAKTTVACVFTLFRD